jgi:quercetin dioxygenase-like cupin family protein
LELGASTATIKVGREQLAVFVAEIGGDFPRPPAHRHLKTAECFYVIDGEFTVILDGEESTLPAGGFAAVPPGTVHASAPPAGPLRFLNVFAPGGLEDYLREAARLGERPDPSGYDIELAN